jgi:predicted dehydrogenase
MYRDETRSLDSVDPNSSQPARLTIGSERVSTSNVNRRLFLSTAATATATTVLSAGITYAAPEKKWRVGVIGHTGRGNYGHGLDTVWLSLPETKIVGLADADKDGRERTRRKLGMVPGFAEYQQMIKQVQPDIVAVSPRHVDQHRDMVLAAIEGGARGIYCEKPFCSTPHEADEIVSACKRSGTRLAIAHRNHYHPVLPVATVAIKEGAIGKLLEIRCRGKEDARGGAQDLWVLGTHLLDLVRHFAGNAVACSAVLLAGERPVTKKDVVAGAEGLGPIAGDRLHARYEMECGIPMYFDSIRNAGVKEANFGLQLVGTEGLIDFRIDIEPLAHFVPGNPFRPTAKPRPWVPISSAGIGKPEPIDNVKRLVSKHILSTRDLLASITEDRSPLSSEEDGRAIIEMIHAAFASHVKNGQRVQLPLADRQHPFANWGRNP